MSFKNSAFSASEGKIILFSSIGIFFVAVLCTIFPALGELVRTFLMWAGALIFGIPYMFAILWGLKEAVNEVLKAMGSELRIDTEELTRDLREVLLVDRAEAVIEEKKMAFEAKKAAYIAKKHGGNRGGNQGDNQDGHHGESHGDEDDSEQPDHDSNAQDRQNSE